MLGAWSSEQRWSLPMSEIALVTDAELTRARQDVAFRHQLVAGNLDGLLSKLNALRNGKVDAEGARQVREGVDLAVQLAELLQRIDSALAETRRAG
jgi:hypothetical protein